MFGTRWAEHAGSIVQKRKTQKKRNDEGNATASRGESGLFWLINTPLPCQSHQRSPLRERLFDLRSMTWKGQDSARAARNLGVFSRWDHVTRPPGSSDGVLADPPSLKTPQNTQRPRGKSPGWGGSLPRGTTSGHQDGTSFSGLPVQLFDLVLTDCICSVAQPIGLALIMT